MTQTLALRHIRVLDLSRVLAGPFCTMQLGDAGADVIKVERPGTGDETRKWGPPFTASGESAYFLGVNRNKRSVAVDFATPRGRDIVRALASSADVVVENFLPGKLEKLGLGYADLRKGNERLVYCSLTGFGQTGPYAARGGYDVVVSAIAGLMGITGPQDGAPCKVGVAMTDLATGLFAHGAILTALLHAQRTGQGQYVSTSLLEAQVALLANIGSNYLIGGREGRRWGTAHESIVPYQAFETADGHVVVGCGNDAQFKVFCGIVGRLDLAEDQRFTTNALRVANRNQLIPQLRKEIRQRPTAHWLELLDGTKLPFGPINSIAQVFADPQVQHADMIQSVDHPTAGPIKMAGFPVKYASTPMSTRRPPPLLGEHTEEILRDLLNLGSEEIASLRAEQVVA